jgi:hypothetical protein
MIVHPFGNVVPVNDPHKSFDPTRRSGTPAPVRA